MIPILYPSSYKDLAEFNNNGLGFLTEATKVQVSEDLNGKFDVYIEYPISGRLFREIASDTFVKVKPNSKDEPHIFRIYETEIQTDRGIVFIEGRSITFDLVGNMVMDVKVSNATPSDAWRALESGAVDPITHRFNSDITTRSNGEWIRTNLLYCISGEEGSMLQKWGGEIKRENFQVSLFRRRGQDNVTTIRHGKNMKGFTATYSTKGIVTAIVPVTTIYNEDSTEPIELVGDIVYSPLANKYPITYYNEVIFTEEDGVVDMASLNAKAERFFTERPNHDKPSINVVIDMIDLSDSPEFYKFKDFENVEIGDTVTVYSKQFDMNLTSKVISIVYNALLEINESIELGTSRASAYEYYKQISRDAVANAIKPIDERINLVQIAANGKNRVFRGVIEPTTGMFKNDLWYKPVGAGETMMYVFDGTYWQLNKVSAGLLGGTLDAENGDVNLINVNVANIVGETSNFIKSWWNNAAGGGVDIDGDGIVTQSGELLTRISAGKVTNQSGTKTGKVDALGMEISDSSNGQTTKLFADGLEFGWYSIIRQITQTNEGLQIKPITGSGFRLNSALNLTAGPGADKVSYLQLDVPGALSSARVQLANKTMSIRHPNDGELIISDYDFDGSKGLTRSGTFRTNPVDGAYLEMEGKEIKTARDGNNNIFLTPSGSGGVRVGSPTSSELYPITALAFVEGSNRDSKTNIKPFEEEALSIVNDLVVTEYNLKVELERGINQRKIGFIAEDSPAISAKQSGSDKLGVDHYKMTAIAIKAIQELDKENNALKQELSDLKDILEEKGLI